MVEIRGKQQVHYFFTRSRAHSYPILRNLRIRFGDRCAADHSVVLALAEWTGLGLIAAIAGNAKKIVATKLQKIPIAHAMPRPVSAGFRARASEPKPLSAVSPASNTGFITPATSCSMSRVFCQISTV